MTLPTGLQCLESALSAIRASKMRLCRMACRTAPLAKSSTSMEKGKCLCQLTFIGSLLAVSPRTHGNITFPAGLQILTFDEFVHSTKYIFACWPVEPEHGKYALASWLAELTLAVSLRKA